MKNRQLITQYILLFIVCIVFSLTGGITATAEGGEDDWTPCKAKYYYSTDDTSDANMLKTIRFWNEEEEKYDEESVFHAYGAINEFYMFLDKGDAKSIELLNTDNEPSDEDKWWGDAKTLSIQPYETDEPILQNIDEESDFITVTPVTGKDGWYKISVKDIVKENFGLSLVVRTVGTNDDVDENGDDITNSWVDGNPITIFYHETTLSVINRDDEADFSNALWGTLPKIPVEFQLRQLKTANNKVAFDTITTPDALDVLISSREDDWEDGQEHIAMADPDTYTLTTADKTLSFTSNIEGVYYLVPKGSYAVEDAASTEPTTLPENSIKIEVWLTDFSFHSAQEKNVDTWLGLESSYKEPQPSAMYVMPYINSEDLTALKPSTIEFAAYNDKNEKLSDYITSQRMDAEDSSIYRITITDKASGDFTIKATGYRNGKDTAAAQDDPWLSEIVEDSIQIKSTLKNIRIKTAPAKTTYTEGEAFDKTGIAVEAVYADDSTYPVTDYTISAPVQFTATDKEVRISWHGMTAKQAITVNAKTTPPQPPVTTEPELKVGDTSIFGGNTYQVIAAAADKKEVAYKSGNKKAKKVTIPSVVTINGTSYKVTEIAAGSFSGNKKLTSVTIPASVVKIGNNAFKNCTKLTKVTIPKNVTAIGKNAFNGCKKIKTLTLKGTKVRSIGKNAFKGVSKKATIKVPKSRKKAYTKLLKKAGFKGKIK